MARSTPLSLRTLLSQRLAHRLFALFLLAAVLPLALSDGISHIAVREVAQTLDERARADTTRRTARQVFDRLLAGKTLLAATPAADPARDGLAAAWLPGLERVFQRLSWLDERGRTAWSSDPAVDLGRRWETAQAGPYNRPPIPESRGDHRIEVRLRVATGADHAPQVLLAVSRDGLIRWIGELRADHLWAPVLDAGHDGLWRVRDARGVELARLGGGDALRTDSDAPQLRTESRLFLGAEFGAGDWVFEQRSPQPEVRWMGQPLSVWLGLVAAATLLGIALLCLWQLRRTLRPLAELTDGARRVAEGRRGTRVQTDRADEIGVLARAFNDMAARIDDREQQLVHRAVHDSLTGLPNRDGLLERLQSLLDAPGAAARLAVLFMDLDHFKDVNDSRGHQAGDQILRLVAQRLHEAVPPGTFVSRLGGDEFVIVLPEADEHDAVAVAQAVLGRISAPYELGTSTHVLGASLGIALSPGHGRTAAELLRCADIALYAAKAGGRGRHQVFQRALDLAARERVSLLAELRQALTRNEFVLHYQPRVRPADGAIDSAEALIRWQHPVRGLLYPGHFIEVAETGGLIGEIGLWVLDAACAQIAAWRNQGLLLGRVSVNVSPQQLADGALVAHVRDALARHHVPPQALELEVTESLLVGDAAAARAQLAELRQWGISIALDDFGTGYSSMAILRQLPIDVMKIDRAFVTDLGRDDGAMAMASAIVAMAKALRLHLVAEGIETEGQATILREMGCDELQGFFYSRPLPPEAFHLLPRHLLPALSGATPVLASRPG